MPIDVAALRSWDFPVLRQSWTDGSDAYGTQALRLRCVVAERGTVVVSNGRATLGDSA
jgi:hypothetical protein